MSQQREVEADLPWEAPQGLGQSGAHARHVESSMAETSSARDARGDPTAMTSGPSSQFMDNALYQPALATTGYANPQRPQTPQVRFEGDDELGYAHAISHAGPTDTAHQHTRDFSPASADNSPPGDSFTLMSAAADGTVSHREALTSAVEYDPETNMLQTRGVKATGGQAMPKRYQQVVTGKRESFYEVKERPNTWLGSLRKRSVHMQPGSGPQRDAPRLERPRFEVAASRFANGCAVMSIFLQGLLGGMALVTLLQVYMFQVATWGDDAVLLLRFYSPVALKMNRLYWVFIIVALGAAVSRAAWSTLVFAPQSIEENLPDGMLDIVRALRFRFVDYLMVLLYSLSFLLNVLSASVDDELDYAISRDPDFYAAALSDGFRTRIQRWHALNTFKCLALLLAWFLVIWEWQPRVLGRILVTVAELEQRRQAVPVTAKTVKPSIKALISTPRLVKDVMSSLQQTPTREGLVWNNASFEPTLGVTLQPSAMAGIQRL